MTGKDTTHLCAIWSSRRGTGMWRHAHCCTVLSKHFGLP